MLLLFGSTQTHPLVDLVFLHTMLKHSLSANGEKSLDARQRTHSVASQTIWPILIDREAVIKQKSFSDAAGGVPRELYTLKHESQGRFSFQTQPKMIFSVKMYRSNKSNVEAIKRYFFSLALVFISTEIIPTNMMMERGENKFHESSETKNERRERRYKRTHLLGRIFSTPSTTGFICLKHCRLNGT